MMIPIAGGWAKETDLPSCLFGAFVMTGFTETFLAASIPGVDEKMFTGEGETPDIWEARFETLIEWIFFRTNY
jgi:hypothetical protein